MITRVSTWRGAACAALVGMLSSLIVLIAAPPASAFMNLELSWGGASMRSPWGVATDSNGMVYVADLTNRRVQKFESDGTFITEWSTGNGQPRAIAIDSLDNVYVLEHARVQKFDSDGEFIDDWGSTGTGNSQFSSPWGIAVGPSDDVYVADTGNDRIQKFDSAGAYVTQWGSEGTADGQFKTPEGIAVDSLGNVYVGDVDNKRIQKFSSSGVFERHWGSTETGDARLLNRFGGLATDSENNVYVAMTNDRLVKKFSSTGSFLAKWGSQGTGDGQFETAVGIATDPANNVYVADGGNSRIQKFTNAGAFTTKWGALDGQFYRPNGIALDASGNVYVVDEENYRIQKFDADGTFITKWGSRGTGEGQFRNPLDIAVDDDGNVYVTDQFTFRVQKFDPTGNFLLEWGSSGPGNGEFGLPQGIDIDSAGNVYVADRGNNRIQKFDTDGTYLSQWGSSGSENGQFNGPFGVAIDSDDNVYVTESEGDRVQKFDSNGTFLSVLAPGSLGAFNDPRGIEVDPFDNVYVLEYSNDRLRKFDPAGAFLGFKGGFGPNSGVFQSPVGIAANSSGQVYVSDFTHRVQRFITIHNLTVTNSGTGAGTVTPDPAGTSCGAGCTTHDHGTVVTLTASPATSSNFTSWSGACSGTELTCEVTMDQVRSVTANFTLKTHSLSVTTSGSGSVTSEPTGIDCGTDCSQVYNHGTVVTLTASPETNSDFTGWAGACTGTGTCQVTMDQARSVTANFALKTYNLSLGSAGSGSGSIAPDPTGESCGPGCWTYDHGDEVTVTPTPGEDSNFAGWSGACTGSEACEVTMDQARNVTGTFDLKTHELTVTKDGTGTGSVTSDDPGIDCGLVCSESFVHNTVLTLTATPDESSQFSGWSGGCLGTGTCEVTMDQANDVTATFIGETSVTVGISKTSSRVTFKGRVRPVHEGEQVVVKLQKKKAGKFVTVKTKEPLLDEESRYSVRFRRAGAKTCRVRTAFTHDDHLPSKVGKTFRC